MVLISKIVNCFTWPSNMTVNWHVTIELRLPSPVCCHRHVYAFLPALILDAPHTFHFAAGPCSCIIDTPPLCLRIDFSASFACLVIYGVCVVLSAISPSSLYYSETVSTLRYANRAKNIVNRPIINEVSHGCVSDTLINWFIYVELFIYDQARVCWCLPLTRGDGLHDR